MPNTFFWGSEIDSLELIASKLLEKSEFESFDSNEDRYIQPVLNDQNDPVYGKSVNDRVSEKYELFANHTINPETGDEVLAVGLFEDFASEAGSEKLVNSLAFKPIIGFFEEFYIVASKQKNVGIYVNGKLVGYTDKLKPSINPSVLADHMPAMSDRALIIFCRSATLQADKLLRKIYPF